MLNFLLFGLEFRCTKSIHEWLLWGQLSEAANVLVSATGTHFVHNDYKQCVHLIFVYKKSIDYYFSLECFPSPYKLFFSKIIKSDLSIETNIDNLDSNFS